MKIHIHIVQIGMDPDWTRIGVVISDWSSEEYVGFENNEAWTRYDTTTQCWRAFSIGKQ